MNLQDARRLLRTLVDVPTQVVRAKVKSVDTDNWTAEVITENGGAERYDVQLRVFANGDSFGVITVPKDDSLVLIGLVENNPGACYLVQCSEVVLVRIEMDDKVLIEIPEDGKVNVKAEEILFDGSTNGLVDREGLVDRLNNIEDDINNFKSALNGLLTPANINTPPPGSPDPFYTAMKGALSAYSNQQLVDTTDNDIKTETITWQ